MEQPLDQESLEAMDALDLLGHGLHTSITKTITDRSVVEERWVEDLTQYLGQYDSATESAFAKNKDRSSVYLNITRVMVNQSEAQLVDLLFPATDKNYGLGPTPNPELIAGLLDDSPAELAPGQKLIDPETNEPVRQSDLARRAQDLAKEAADKMEREIDDQLVECDYAAQAREMLHYATIFGTGILAGPEASVVTHHKFGIEEPSEPGKSRVTVMHSESVLRPQVRCVAPWDFFPDMSAPSLEDAEFIYERSFMTKKQMRKLLKRTHFIKENVAKVLMENPRTTHSASMGHVNELRRLTGTQSNDIDDNRYEVWTYHGPIEKDALIAAGVALDEDDPLDEFEGVVVFCNSIVLKAVLNPLESEERPYSTWCWHKDDFSIFGFGVPWLCRNEQRIVNTAWRMMLDNSAKSAGPQVVAKRSAISPADGENELSPWKVWWADETVTDVRNAFTVFTFPSVQQEISNILQLAKGFLTETAGLPPAVGQGAGQTPSTLGGMAMLMNSSNTDRRRQVRDWDDTVTTPMIQRFYYWNMQYNLDDSIKGDYEVHARGSSALLLREQQAINLMAVLDKYAAHPVLQGALKSDAALRKVIQALHIDPDELVKTEDEIKAEAKAQSEQEPEKDPQIVIEEMRAQQIQMRSQFTTELETFKAQNEQEMREGDRQLRRDLALLEVQKQDRELQMQALKLSETKDISYQKILADLKKHRWRMNLDQTKHQNEIELKATEGPTGNYGIDG